MKGQFEQELNAYQLAAKQNSEKQTAAAVAAEKAWRQAIAATHRATVAVHQAKSEVQQAKSAGDKTRIRLNPYPLTA